MKRYIYSLIILASVVWSCDDYINVVPDNVPTIDHAFLDRASTERYLATCYSYLPELTLPAGNPAILGSDEYYVNEDPVNESRSANFAGLRMRRGEQNINHPYFNFWDGFNYGKPIFQAIRDCNVFLENVHNVGGDLSEMEARRWAAEVKFLKAYYHFYLLRLYGPIPLMKENLPISASSDEVKAYRDPFDDCVDYIVSLIDEAVPDLPLEILNRGAEMGRITQPAALTLKAKLLVVAASPLFNGNPEYANLTDNSGANLFKGKYDQNKWERAAIACKNAIDTCLLAGHDLYEFTKLANISDSTKQLLSLRHVVHDRWNKEIIWSTSRFTMNTYYIVTTPFFTPEQMAYTPTNPFVYPTLTMAELFYSNRGVPIEEDIEFDYENRYNPFVAPADHGYYIQPGYETAGLNIGREPRFYANLAFDGAIWFGNGRFKDVGDGLESEQPWIIRTKNGQTQGKMSSIRYSVTGYWCKKTSHYESASASSSSSVVERSTFPAFRLSDLYLLYAEALNESLSAPTPEVYHYLDLVRARAGLDGVVESWEAASMYPEKPKTREGMRDIIRQERMIELAFEGERFYDARRWKIAYDLFNRPIQGFNAEGTTTEEFNRIVTLEIPEFRNRDYLEPIRLATLRVNSNLVQNPYW